MCMYVCEHRCVTIHVEVRRLFRKMVLAFHHVILSPGSQAWWQAPWTVLSYLASPKNVFLCDRNTISNKKVNNLEENTLRFLLI